MQRTLSLTLLLAGLLAMSPPVTAETGSVTLPRQAASNQDEAERIDLNTATATELEALPGIGPRTAQLIVEYREEHGGFEKVEDLMNIRGIGERTFLRLRPLVRVSTPGSQPDPR